MIKSEVGMLRNQEFHQANLLNEHGLPKHPDFIYIMMWDTQCIFDGDLSFAGTTDTGGLLHWSDPFSRLDRFIREHFELEFIGVNEARLPISEVYKIIKKHGPSKDKPVEQLNYAELRKKLRSAFEQIYKELFYENPEAFPVFETQPRIVNTVEIAFRKDLLTLKASNMSENNILLLKEIWESANHSIDYKTFKKIAEVKADSSVRSITSRINEELEKIESSFRMDSKRSKVKIFYSF